MQAIVLSFCATYHVVGAFEPPVVPPPPPVPPVPPVLPPPDGTLAVVAGAGVPVVAANAGTDRPTTAAIAVAATNTRLAMVVIPRYACGQKTAPWGGDISRFRDRSS